MPVPAKPTFLKGIATAHEADGSVESTRTPKQEYGIIQQEIRIPMPLCHLANDEKQPEPIRIPDGLNIFPCALAFASARIKLRARC
jgi:hypothetical protein